MKYKNIIIFYHKNCKDGFGSAWTAHQKFKNSASYVAIDYQDKLPNIKNKVVYFIDVTFPEKITGRFIERNEKTMIIDHHISQKRIVDLAKKKIYDIKRSASILTWQYFFKKKEIPKLLLYIEDMDLWKFKKKHTREILNAVDTYKKDFSNWDLIAEKLESKEGFKDLLKIGKRIEEKKRRKIDKIIEGGNRIIFEGHKTIAVNSRIFASEIGSTVVNSGNKIALIYYIKDGVLNVSLRSDGKTDVSKLAKKYNGGGHKSSAGFFIKNFKKLPWKEIK